MEEELEELEEFIVEPFLGDEIDFDFEFEAPHFFDFARPETYLEAIMAESWFESAESYPPSPFAIKLKQREAILMENDKASANSGDVENLNTIHNYTGICEDSEASTAEDNYSGSTFYYHMAKDISEGKTKLPSKSTRTKSSTLMKPTASQLAKLNKSRDVHFTQSLRRFQKVGKIDEKSCQNNSSMVDSKATKRQKLETGYLCKGTHLRHQNSLLHKTPNKVGLTNVYLGPSRLKVTIPREPDLETTHRAQRHRAKIKAEPGGEAKQNAYMFKARPLNKKILEGPSLPLHKKSTPQLPEFQVFHLKTLERAMQHPSCNTGNIFNFNPTSPNEGRNIKRPNSSDTLRHEKCRTVIKLSHSRSNKELKYVTEKRILDEPPEELFSKLSLAPGVQPAVKSRPKEYQPNQDSKENQNASGSFHQEHEMINLLKEEMHRYCGKKLQCGSDGGIPENELHLYNNRRLDIC